MWLRLWTYPYLFIMVSAIVFVTIAQACSNRALKVPHAALLLAGLAMTCRSRRCAIRSLWNLMVRWAPKVWAFSR